jgi:hypothetical protein
VLVSLLTRLNSLPAVTLLRSAGESSSTCNSNSSRLATAQMGNASLHRLLPGIHTYTRGWQVQGSLRECSAACDSH